MTPTTSTPSHLQELSESIDGNNDANVALQAVELTSGGRSFLVTNTARVDPSGNDSTGKFGDPSKPFLTVQGAITAIEALENTPDHPVIIIPRGYDYFGDDITTSLPSIMFQGSSENDSVENLILTANQLELIFNNCTSSNITADSPGGLYLKIDTSGEIAGNVTNSSGFIHIVSSGGGLVGGTLSCPGHVIFLQGVNWAREDQTVVIDSAGSDVTATQCFLTDTTAANVTMNDSRFKPGGTLNISGTITYNNMLLSGGGITVWDSITPYSTGALVLDRGGTWQATGTNTNSQPVSGNTDWTLIGGTPYVDVLLDPPALISSPFYDPTASGPGYIIVPAPGTGFIVWPVRFQTFVTPSDGVFWQNDISAYLGWLNPAGNGSPFISGLKQAMGTGLYGSNNDQVGRTDPWKPDGADDSIYSTSSTGSQENQPLVIWNPDDIGTPVGNTSLAIRVYYQIRPIRDESASLFFSILGVDQGTKTFQVNGYTRITGSISVIGSTGNDQSYTIVSTTPSDTPGPTFGPDNITAVDQGAKIFTKTGSPPAQGLIVGDKLVVAGSTLNDGTYTITAVSYHDDTSAVDVTVAEAIPDSTPDGTMQGLNATDIVVVEAIPDGTADGWVKK